MSGKTVRIEMEMPSVELAKKGFPSAHKMFCGGTARLGMRAAGMSATCFLEGEVVVVEIVFPSSEDALALLPRYQKKMEESVAKEKDKVGSCIGAKVFLKEE